MMRQADSGEEAIPTMDRKGVVIPDFDNSTRKVEPWTASENLLVGRGKRRLAVLEPLLPSLQGSSSLAVSTQTVRAEICFPIFRMLKFEKDLLLL